MSKIDASNDYELLVNDYELIQKRVKELQDLNLKMFTEYQRELKSLQSKNRQLDDRCIEYKQVISNQNQRY